MGDDTSRNLDRRTVLGRGAAVAVGVWTVPVIQSFASPAAAASGPPAVALCPSQTFTVDRNGSALAFSSGRDRSFNVNLGATFSAISMIWVRLFQSPADPVGPGDTGSVMFRTSPTTSSGVIFQGGNTLDPITFGFGPGSGGIVTYHSLLLDGVTELIVSADAVGTGDPVHTFALTKVEIEVCGTLAPVL